MSIAHSQTANRKEGGKERLPEGSGARIGTEEKKQAILFSDEPAPSRLIERRSGIQA